MKRTEEIRISKQGAALLKFTQVMAHATEGHKTTKGALAEWLIYRGTIELSKDQGWEIPEDLRYDIGSARTGKADQAQR